MSSRIICFGSVNIDHVYHVGHIVEPGETIKSNGYCKYWGGKGLNQAMALARAGADVFLAAKVNASEHRDVTQLCSESGIDSRFIVTSEDCTGHALIQVSDDGQNCIIVAAGANSTITTDDIERTIGAFGQSDILVLQNEINMIPEIIFAAKMHGLKIVLNPSPCTNAIKSWPLELIDMLILNEIEGRLLSGASDNGKITSALLEEYPCMKIVLTLGKDGCEYRDQAARFVCPARKVKVIDTTAAGDTFTGYLLAALASGRSIQNALETATAAAAIAVSRPGATASIPSMSEVLAFLL